MAARSSVDGALG